MAGEVSVGLYTGSVGEIAKSKGVAKKVVRLHLAVSNSSERFRTTLRTLTLHINAPHKCTSLKSNLKLGIQVIFFIVIYFL